MTYYRESFNKYDHTIVFLLLETYTSQGVSLLAYPFPFNTRKWQFHSLSIMENEIQGGSDVTGTDFFSLNHNYQTLTRTCQSSMYSPPESTRFFQRSGSVLMPLSKKACGRQRIHSRTVCMTASSSANRLSALSEALRPLKHTGP
jgi:hypothetical protein